MSGNRNSAYEKLEIIFKDKPHLISNRGFLSDIVFDTEIKRLIEKYFSMHEITEFYSVLQQEAALSQSFVDEAKKLKEYYQQKKSALG